MHLFLFKRTSNLSTLYIILVILYTEKKSNFNIRYLIYHIKSSCLIIIKDILNVN